MNEIECLDAEACNHITGYSDGFSGIWLVDADACLNERDPEVRFKFCPLCGEENNSPEALPNKNSKCIVGT